MYNKSTISMYSNRTFYVIMTIFLFLLQTFVQSKNVVDFSQTLKQFNEKYDVKFSDSVYQQLTYFVRSSALSSCITHYGLNPGFTLKDGGCPAHIEFCHNYTLNPSIGNSTISAVFEASQGELGTGYVMVDYSNKTIIVVFRSSTTSEDWFSDFTIQPTKYSPISQTEYWKLVKNKKLSPCQNCQLHKGVSKFTKSLGRDFLVKIEHILKRYPTFKIVITGHSLGAALASIVGIELRLRGYHPLVLTYASPKIFNSNLKNWVNELFDAKMIHKNILNAAQVELKRGYFRIVHKNDYIPLVPPFYKAAGLEIFIKKISLPHELEDLQYNGMISDTFPLMEYTDNISGLVDQLLHTYEHTSYFIYLKGCKYF